MNPKITQEEYEATSLTAMAHHRAALATVRDMSNAIGRLSFTNAEACQRETIHTATEIAEIVEAFAMHLATSTPEQALRFALISRTTEEDGISTLEELVSHVKQTTVQTDSTL